jgi:putative transposase
MATRIPASQRTREELSALIEGRLSTASAKDELVKLATRLILEEALEGEAGDALGRDYYEAQLPDAAAQQSPPQAGISI